MARIPEVEVICFDAAGTLFEVRGSVGRIYSAAARQFGVEDEPERVDAAFTRAFRMKSAEPLPEVNGDQAAAERRWWFAVVKDVFGARMPAEILPRYFDAVFELFRCGEAWNLFPETLEALGRLRARGTRLCVVSNFDSRLLDVLEALEIRDFFEQVVLSWSTGCAKPDPRIFGAALQSMNVAAPRAAHVGDSFREDVEGAVRAGMVPVLLDRSGDEPVPAGAVRICSLLELCG